jgi:hypothetical protein
LSDRALPKPKDRTLHRLAARYIVNRKCSALRLFGKLGWADGPKYIFDRRNLPTSARVSLLPQQQSQALVVAIAINHFLFLAINCIYS